MASTAQDVANVKSIERRLSICKILGGHRITFIDAIKTMLQLFTIVEGEKLDETIQEIQETFVSLLHPPDKVFNEEYL